jgi:hypothetical protein
MQGQILKRTLCEHLTTPQVSGNSQISARTILNKVFLLWFFFSLGKFQDSIKNQATNASFRIRFISLKALADPKELYFNILLLCNQEVSTAALYFADPMLIYWSDQLSCLRFCVFKFVLAFP